MVAEAARVAGVGRSTAYDRRKRDEEFAAAWDELVEASTEELEHEAIRRAKNGSDVLLMFMLKARRPQIYVERHQVRHSGGGLEPMPPHLSLTKAGSDAAHEFLEKIRDGARGDDALEAHNDCLRKRPAEHPVRRPK